MQRPTLTLGVTVHAVGVPADVPDGLQSHGLTLAGQPGLGTEEGDKERCEQPGRIGRLF